MSKRSKSRRKAETSKQILWLDITAGILLTIAVVAGDLAGRDMSNSAVVAGLWDGQLALVIGAYQWKAKNENRSKHAMALVRELADKYGIEAVAHLAEIILKD